MQAYDAILADQGGTFRCNADGTYSRPENIGGYYVSRAGAEVQVAAGDLTYGELVTYVRNHATVLAAPDNYFGVWIEDGIAYLDVTTQVENYHSAVALGRKNKQLAIWDVAENRAYTL